MFKKLILIAAALFLIQCGGESASNDFVKSETAKVYELKGKVVSVDKANKTASIAHEEIAGFMEPMTMDFTFKEEWVWEALAPGAQVQADLVVDNVNGRSWLENPRIVSSSSGESAEPPKDDVAVVGKEVIDFTLTDQDGKPLTPADFKGKAWAVTFIYSQCPLPDYCILMSKNFSDIANKIAEDESLSDDLRLVSISFDPERDTPERLKAYGLGYLGKHSKATDFKVWRLAVGDDKKVKPVADFFGLRYEVDAKDQTQFNHSLRTIVIGPDGKVRKVLSGNEWKPDDLLKEMKMSLGGGTDHSKTN